MLKKIKESRARSLSAAQDQLEIDMDTCVNFPSQLTMEEAEARYCESIRDASFLRHLRGFLIGCVSRHPALSCGAFIIGGGIFTATVFLLLTKVL